MSIADELVDDAVISALEEGGVLPDTFILRLPDEEFDYLYRMHNEEMWCVDPYGPDAILFTFGNMTIWVCSEARNDQPSSEPS